MGLERQSNLPGKWYNPAEHKWDNEERYHLTWQVSTLLTPEEQRKRKIRTLKLHLDYVVTRNIPQSNIRKSGAVWDVAFDNWTTVQFFSALRYGSPTGTEELFFNRKSI
ncbi:hypothetical protein RB195_018623 [Necator americanus]|uniref:Uncharacterized protein n=1 Tax=Necator americanus TaxID=51031 RepID=A0ABR1CAL6_NECAM